MQRRFYSQNTHDHVVAVRSTLEMDVIFWELDRINFYCKVSLVDVEEVVFQLMVERNTIAWNLMIAGYLQDEQINKAFVKSRCLDMGRGARGYKVTNKLDSDKM